MTVNYPNGRPIKPKTKEFKNQTVYAKRGMRLEETLNQSNAWYNNHGLAVIHKKPTPIQVVKVDYPKRSRAVIKEAYYRQASTTDYNGIYKGRYIDFEAKQTTQKTSFPLSNIHDHQISHMQACLDHGGIVFIVVFFSSLNRYFVLPFEKLANFIEENSNQKSIPLSYFEEEGIEVLERVMPRLDYLKAIDPYLKPF